MTIELNMDPRQAQVEGLNFFKESIENDKKFILYNLPTGIGKSYLVMMIADWFLKNKNQGAKFDIITNSKLLQEQYTNDFDFLPTPPPRT